MPPRDRPIHGAEIQEKLRDSVSDIGAIRQALGIAPDRLIVLEFNTLDPAARGTLEQRLNAMVLDEQRVTRNGDQLIRMLVQFPTVDSIGKLEAELGQYQRGDPSKIILPTGLRRSFFDGLETIRKVRQKDRMGRQIESEGFPDQERFPLDVDLWHPGADKLALDMLDQVRQLCQGFGGRVTDELKTRNLLLVRVQVSRELAETLLDLDWVAHIDLPPRLPKCYEYIFSDSSIIPRIDPPTGAEPIVCVIDSGVLSAHILLRGWVAEAQDFNSGEGSAVDQQGHGTQVAGLAVYGSIAKCLDEQEWNPKVRVACAKVLRRHEFDDSVTTFPPEHRAEALIERAIRHFHSEHNCRVFNLSIGNRHQVYAGGRQFPWAELLDDLARELDIVIVVAAGNVAEPPMPDNARTHRQFKEGVRDLLMNDPAARICSPATAAIALTIGAIARSDSPRTRDSFAASPRGTPSPFSRTGPGYEVSKTSCGVKPDFVAYGGNFAIKSFGSDARWVVMDSHLGEPTTRLDTDGDRPLMAATGTSYAAPQVSHAAALVSAAIPAGMGEGMANVIRAVLGVCAAPPECDPAWLGPINGSDPLRMLYRVGYGAVDAIRATESDPNDVVAFGHDAVKEDHWHVYAVPVPDEFMDGKGARGIAVALAYDPPVRSSRKEYLARTMWLDVFKGLTVEQVAEFRSPHIGNGSPPPLPQRFHLGSQPGKQAIQWSTLQVRRKLWTRATQLPHVGDGSSPILHIVVGCQNRFPHDDSRTQRYGIALRFWHKDPSVDLYQYLKANLRARATVQVQARRLQN